MTARATLAPFIPDIAEQHFDELQFLWAQRRAALRSSAYREREIRLLEQRIEAHVDGLLVIEERLDDFLAAALAGDDEMPAFAAAFALLRRGEPDAVRRVGGAFEMATQKKLEGLRDALANAPLGALAEQLGACFLSGSPPLAAAAGEALVFHGIIGPDISHLRRLMTADQPNARAGAFRIAAYSGAAVPPTAYEGALRDDDVAVKWAALTAAAWSASPIFAPHCRALAATPSGEAVEPLMTFAAVALPEEYQLIEAVAADPAGGPQRFRILGSFAHPYFIDLLIREMENPDPATAIAAGAAFTKMTGRDVESNTRVKVSSDGKPPANDFEAEFQDELFLPDPDLARKHWQELAPALARSPRICRGMDVSRPLSREQFAALDMESRWEYCLRMRLFGGWQGTPLVLERYPQRV